MNVHKNARLTPSGRVLMVERIQAGWSVARAASAGGVSKRTAYRWLGRYRGGDRLLADRSSAPRHCRHRLASSSVRAIERLRRERLTGPQIAQVLGLAVSSVGLVLRRLGLNRLAQLEPKPSVIRYERERPGEMLHLDTKKLGRFEQVGHRFVPRGHSPQVNKGKHGWDHLHVAIDDASRLAYTEVLASDAQADTTAFFQRACAWFEQLGISIERVMTDNGPGYRSKLFAATLRQTGVRHIRTRPYTPKTNGKAERFIQSSLREWAYARPYLSSDHRNLAATDWMHFYNLARPHYGIGRITPWQRVNNLLGNDS
jgi:transposase InsO family protein